MRRGQNRGGGTWKATVRYAATALGGALVLVAIAAAPGTAAAAPAGCAGKPGTPDRGALLQYCPQDPRSIASGGGGAAAPPSSRAPTGAPNGKSQRGHSDRPGLPLTGYPSSDGINFLLLVLVLLAIAAAVAYGARRWRRSRPQPS